MGADSYRGLNREEGEGQSDRSKHLTKVYKKSLGAPLAKAIVKISAGFRETFQLVDFCMPLFS